MTPWLLMTLVVVTTHATAEWFSSFAHILHALDVESKLLNFLDQYVENEQARITYLRGLHDRMSWESCSKVPNTRECMGNPTNQLALMKRLAYTWNNIYTVASDRNASERFLWHLSMKPELPTHDDVIGSVRGVIRIQQTYGFSAAEISRGIVGASIVGLPLNARDCYDMAHTANIARQYAICFEWTVEAKRMISAGDKSIPLTFILYQLAICVYELGNLPFAFETVHEIARIAPDFTEVANFYRHVVAEAKSRGVKFRGDYPSVFDVNVDVPTPRHYTELEQLCQQHRTLKLGAVRNLRCYLWNGYGNPRLLFQPIKIEVESERPFLYRFHDFVSDSEIQQLKEIATPLLHRAAVIYGNGSSAVSDVRVTKTAFLDDSHNRTVARISTRMGDTAGFDTKRMEKTAVTNYGVGGHYAAHLDAFVNITYEAQEQGNRLATVLIYLSDVDFGGSTVFPSAGIVVRPIKGSAVMWYSLFPNGTVDNMTLHAGCPVATGEKWIINKWIREKAQTTCAPCLSESCPESTHRLPLGYSGIHKTWK